MYSVGGRFQEIEKGVMAKAVKERLLDFQDEDEAYMVREMMGRTLPAG
jgi:hypothetical protein